MGYGDLTSFLALVISSLALLVGAIIAVFVYVRFAPTLHLRIIPRWADKGRQFVILRIEVENKSNIRVWKKLIQLQVLEHKIRTDLSLSEWVPFTKQACQEVPDIEKPIEPKDAVEIFKTTKRIYPREVKSVERLYPFHHENILHVGLHVRGTLGWGGRMATLLPFSAQRWTITIIVTECLPEGMINY